PVGPTVTQISNSFMYSDSVTGTKTSNTDTIAVNDAPNVSISKSDNGVSSGPGGTIVYTVSYSNVGRKQAEGVVITETVPANTTFNAAASAPSVWSCANGSAAGTTCTITVGNVAGGGAGSYKFAVNVVNPLPAGTTQVQNTASIALNPVNTGPDPVPGNNTATDITPVGTGPTIAPASVTRTAGTPVSNSQIATVTDDLAPASSIVVVPTSIPAGLSITNITNINGMIYADVRADCNATVGANTVVLKGTDSANNMVMANLTVTVVMNPVPTFGTYPATTTVNLSGSTNVTPSAAPTDNGTISTLVATAPGFTGNLSVNPATGNVNVSNAGP
ncbi:MAG: hypothetical protein M3X11_12060, partial [Acidobacteriota bacterium]|nr:hypothetical protein [Acidobacteriota bacterium]